MALYRKYRPATFSEVVGQEHVTEPLSTALDSGRVNHAYLFSGPRGCGKTSSARILARSLNCEQGPTSSPCGVCGSCVALAPGGPGNLDVTEMDAASHGGVDDARELRDRAFFAPAESRYRVFIVDEAHMVTPQGFNALLKIVEEPPAHLIFIFATTEPEKVLTTIRSRTHHYPFRLLAPNVMRPLLEKITAAENVPVEPAVFPLVIRAGGGSPRDSLSILDQLLAGAGESGVTYGRALGLLGVTDAALIDTAVGALGTADGAALFGAVEQVMEAGHDPRRFATDLLERFRDLILLHTVPDATERGLIDVPVDVLETMRAEAAELGLATLTRCAEVTHASLAEMRGATSPRLLLEVMCARLLLPAADDSHAALLQRLEILERRPAGPVPTAGSVPTAASVPTSPPSDQSQFVRPSSRPETTPEPANELAEAEPVLHRPAITTVKTEPTRPRDPAPIPPPEPASAAEPEPPAPQPPAPQPPAPQPSGPSLDDVRTAWPKVLRAVGSRSKVTATLMTNMQVVGLTGDTLVLGLPVPALLARFSDQTHQATLRDAVREVFETDWQVDVGDGGAGGAGTQPAPAAPRQASSADPQRRSAPTFERRSRASDQPTPMSRADSRPAGRENGPPAGADDIPLPPEPEPEPAPGVEISEEEMMADAARDDAASGPTGAPRRDPGEIALELIRTELGGRPI